MLPTPIGIWERDAQFGYSHMANSSGTHETPDFKVTYTIGGDKERYIPVPESPVGQILFLGGSFTFGHGVNDDENYPYILSTDWTRWHIVNKAVMGWGTSHAYMALSKVMKSDNPPSMVIYAMIPHHVERNYIRKSWVKIITEHDRGHPHFELIDKNLAFQGVVNGPNSLEDTPGMHDKEIELTKAFLVEMQNICHKHHIPFIVILLRHNVPYAINKTLIENNILVLDLSEIKIEGFTKDEHPNHNDHKRIADAISDSFIPEILKSILSNK